MERRTVEQLAGVEDPAWPAIARLVDQAGTARVLDADPERARRVLFNLQVTARSCLGALALNTGGVLADHGWFRLLGGGSEHLADLAAVNGLDADGGNQGPPPYLIIGFDALGGRFTIDGGGLGVAAGEVCYRGPDSLAWGGLGGGHADFVTAAIAGGLRDAFAALRWPGWEDEVAALRPDQGLALYPPPFSRQGQDLAGVTRRAVPLSELLEFYDEAARQLDALDR